MRRLISLALFGILFAVSFSVSTQAQTTTTSAESSEVPDTIKIAILNLEGIRRQAKVMTNIRDQVEVYRTAFTVEIKKEEEALRNANQELARKRSILSPEAFVEERRKFEKRVVLVQQLVQQRKQALDKVQAFAMNEVNKKLDEIIAKLASEQKIGLVLRGEQTILVTNSMDITRSVLDRLDQQFSTVVVPKPEQNN